MNEDNIAKIFSGRPCRISKKTYDAGVHFGGSMIEGYCYVVSGSCLYKFGEKKIRIDRFYWATLPGGSYTFSVIGNEPVSIILVWPLEGYMGGGPAPTR